MQYECFIGSFSKESDAAIVRGMFDSQTCSLIEINSIPATCPSYLCLNKENNVLYCVNEAAMVNDVPGSSIESYNIPALPRAYNLPAKRMHYIWRRNSASFPVQPEAFGALICMQIMMQSFFCRNYVRTKAQINDVVFRYLQLISARTCVKGNRMLGRQCKTK